MQNAIVQLISGIPATLQDVLDRLGKSMALSDTRRRDLRSAVRTLARLGDIEPSELPLDLSLIRLFLDQMVPVEAKVSAKRWANLRSDLTAAIEASGLRPMLKCSKAEFSPGWIALFEKAKERKFQHGLSRFARWASARFVEPVQVNRAVFDRFISDLEAASLTRRIPELAQNLVRVWNALCRKCLGENLQTVQVVRRRKRAQRVPWEDLTASFRQDIEKYLTWVSVPDPLDENARPRALAERTCRLRRDHIHSAVTAAADAGIDLQSLQLIRDLVKTETFRQILRHRWETEGRKLTAYNHGIAGTLISIAYDWVKLPADEMIKLKEIRRKLGMLPFGLTEKNKALLRQFDDPRLLRTLLDLPDKIWSRARRKKRLSMREFVELQSALAIDLLLHAPIRMSNLVALLFGRHLQWTQGHGKAAIMVFMENETKNHVPLEFEIPLPLADRLLIFRNEIVPAVTGKRHEAVFVTWQGKPRTQAAIALAIHKTVRIHTGVKLTPHQFRHLAAKILLNENPQAFKLLQELMGHKNTQTTTNFYAGIDTKRAGRAHAEALSKVRKKIRYDD